MEIGSVEEAARETSVGGVWAIAQVKADPMEDEYQVVVSRKNMKAKLKDREGVEKKGDFVKNKPKKEGDFVKNKPKVEKEGDFVKDKLKSICAVSEAGPWKTVGPGEITVDSTAEESACPKNWGQVYKTKEPEKWLKFMNASGGRMGHYGAKEATFTTGKEKTVMGLGFQISDVQKPLAAVWRIVEKGNVVQFGPRPEDNFIKNLRTDKKVQMVRKGGSYVIEAEFVTNEKDFTRQALTTV